MNSNFESTYFANKGNKQEKFEMNSSIKDISQKDSFAPNSVSKTIEEFKKSENFSINKPTVYDRLYQKSNNRKREQQMKESKKKK